MTHSPRRRRRRWSIRLIEIPRRTRGDPRRRRVDQAQRQRIEHERRIQAIRRERRHPRCRGSEDARHEYGFGADECGGGDEDRVVVVCDCCRER